MDNLYESAYQQMLQEGVDNDIAIDVVNVLYEENILQNIDEAAASRLVSGLSKALGLNRMSTVNTLRMMKGMLGPGFSPALQRRMGGQVLKSSPKPTPVPAEFKQGNLIAKSGKAQDFTKGKMPFVGTDPVPAPSSALKPPATPQPEVPGQMRIPGLSDAAQNLRNITRNPNTGLPGSQNTGFGIAGGNPSKRNKTIFKAQQLLRSPELPSPPTSPKPKLDLKKAVIPSALAAGGSAVGLTIANNENQRSKREDEMLRKTVQQQIETEKAGRLGSPGSLGDGSNRPTPSPVKPEKMEKPVTKEKLTAAAKDFDAAFASARSAGKTEFTWRGKKYNTKYKEER